MKSYAFFNVVLDLFKLINKVNCFSFVFGHADVENLEETDDFIYFLGPRDSWAEVPSQAVGILERLRINKWWPDTSKRLKVANHALKPLINIAVEILP